MLEDEEYNEVKEWLHTHIADCENSLKECDDLGKAFEDFANGKKEFERRNFGSAEDYFMSAQQIFEEYGFEKLIPQSQAFLRRIEEYQTAKKSRRGIVVLIVGLCAGAIIFGLICWSWKLLQDTMYRNEKYSTFDSLLYTFHIKRFPEFSVIRNPYYAGKPVRDPSMFFGREPLYEFLKSNLVSPGQSPSIIFYGERKTGKTSILFQIESGKLNLGKEFIPVYIDMNKMVIKDNYEFLSNVVSQIQRTIEVHQIQMPMIPLEKKENPHLYFKDIFLREIADSVGEKRILFLIDEYEVIEKKVSGGKLSREILSYLKSVIEPEIKLDFIFTGSKRVEDLKYFDEWSYTLGASVSRKISFLREKDAVKLIKYPVVKKVWHTNRAVKKLLEFTGCHPYFIQHVCFNLVTLLNENESFTIDIKEVEEVIQDIVNNPIPQVEYLWRRLSKNQKELVSFLAEEIRKEGDSISWWRIIDEFKEKKIGLPRNESAILDDLEELKEKDILKRTKREYSFCADIFRQFVAEHYPPQRVS